MAFREFVSSPEFQQYMDLQGMQGAASTPEELGEFQKGQVKLWADVLQKAGVQPE
jgi:tripartite-type tricarboxylate transporter receptor subunit TctC